MRYLISIIRWGEITYHPIMDYTLTEHILHTSQIMQLLLVISVLINWRTNGRAYLGGANVHIKGFDSTPILHQRKIDAEEVGGPYPLGMLGRMLIIIQTLPREWLVKNKVVLFSLLWWNLSSDDSARCSNHPFSAHWRKKIFPTRPIHLSYNREHSVHF